MGSHRYSSTVDSAGARLRVNDFLFIDGSFATGGGAGTIDITTFFDLGTTTLGSFFSRVLSACCAPSLLWTAIDPLPSGLTLGTDGTLSGTPTVGTHTFKIRAADGQFPAANYAEQRFTLRVAPFVPSPFTNVTSGTLPYGNVGTPYNAQIVDTSTGGTITWTLPVDQYLPPGITLSPNGTLNGTPTATGQFGFNLLATDVAGNTQTRFFSISILAAGAVPPLDLAIGPNLGTFAIGQITVSLTATGGVGPFTYSLTPGAPVVPGMRVQSGQPLPLNSTAHAVFIGVVTQPGTYTTSIRVTDSGGSMVDRAVNFVVLPLQILSQPTLPRAAVGTPYSFTFTPYGAPGFTGPYSWSVTGQPSGLSLTAGGTLQGHADRDGHVQRSRRADGSAVRLAVDVVLYAGCGSVRDWDQRRLARWPSRDIVQPAALRARLRQLQLDDHRRPAGGTGLEQQRPDLGHADRREHELDVYACGDRDERQRAATVPDPNRRGRAAAVVHRHSQLHRPHGGRKLRQHAHRAGRHRAVYLVARLRHAPDGNEPRDG